MSAAVAETTVNLLVYPLDTWKTHRQWRWPAHHPPSSALLSARPAPVARVAHRVTALCRHAYAGVGAGLMSSAVDAFIFALVYDLARRHLHAASSVTSVTSSVAPSVKPLPVNNSVVKDLLASTLGTLMSTAASAPLALARDRTRLGLCRGVATAWSSATSAVGWQGLYAGAAPSLWRDIPMEALQFAAYELSRRLADLNPASLAAVLAGAGALSGVLVAPIDLAVTRVVADPVRNQGVVRTLARVVRTEGMSAALGGASHMAAREALCSALFFLVYDVLNYD